MTYYFSIDILATEFEKFYKGEGQRTIVRDSNGVTIDIPTRLFLPFVSKKGVQGYFKLDNSGSKSVLGRINNLEGAN